MDLCVKEKATTTFGSYVILGNPEDRKWQNRDDVKRDLEKRVLFKRVDPFPFLYNLIVIQLVEPMRGCGLASTTFPDCFHQDKGGKK